MEMISTGPISNLDNAVNESLATMLQRVKFVKVVSDATKKTLDNDKFSC